MGEPRENASQAQRRPNRALTAVLPGQDSFQAVLGELSELGMDVSEVVVLHGVGGIESFDITGEHHGWRAQLIRSWKNMGGADADMFLGYQKALEQGQWLVLVPILTGHPPQELAVILQQHGGSEINFFANGSMQTIL